MNNNCSKLKRIAIFLVGISAVSFPLTSSAGWSILGLDRAIVNAIDINDSGQVVGYASDFLSMAGRMLSFLATA